MNYFIWEELVRKYRLLAKDFEATAVNCQWAPLACADIDALVGKNYTVPFTPAPLFIKNLAMDMCYYQMTYREADQKILKAYIDERVEGVLNGTIILTDPTGTQVSQSARVFLTTSGTRSSFGMDHVENFSVDSSWQQDYRDSRWS